MNDTDQPIDHAIDHTVAPAPFRRALLSWYDTNDRDLPWRSRWSVTGDPYVVWVSEIMLQQTVIKVVVPAYTRFLTKLPTVQDLAAATPDEVRLAARGLGYYRRFGLLHKGAMHVVSEKILQGPDWWPANADEWQTIPGIGAYTAAAIASITRGEPVAVLDGNVERVLCRLYGIREAVGTPAVKRRLAPLAAHLLDERRSGDFNQAMMELGQLVCTKAAPRCDACPVRTKCLAQRQGLQAEIPLPKARRALVDVGLHARVAWRPVAAPKSRSQDRGYEVQLLWRDDSARFVKGSWGFPFLPHGRDTKPPRVVGSFSHTITHHRLTVTVSLVKGDNGSGGRWLPAGEIESQLLANLDRKAWRIAQRSLRTRRGS